jgi:phosphatidylserine/phosphatidylglycerophosphate/cardiolipin synthase-like enzyme
MSNLIRDGEITSQIIEAANNATRSISLIVYTGHVPGARSMPKVITMHKALKQAALRGLQCRLILAGWLQTHPQAIANNQMKRDYEAHGWQVKQVKIYPICHPKLFIFDGEAAIIGSHNYTGQGLTSTKNLSVWVRDQPTILDIDKYYLSIWHDDKYIQS